MMNSQVAVIVLQKGLFQKKSTPPRWMVRWKFSREGGVEGSGNPGRRGGFGPKNSSLGVIHLDLLGL